MKYLCDEDCNGTNANHECIFRVKGSKSCIEWQKELGKWDNLLGVNRVSEEPKKCKCGGTFVSPNSLGFEADDNILVCDNEDLNGRPCEEWIANTE